MRIWFSVLPIDLFSFHVQTSNPIIAKSYLILINVNFFPLKLYVIVFVISDMKQDTRLIAMIDDYLFDQNTNNELFDKYQ